MIESKIVKPAAEGMVAGRILRYPEMGISLMAKIENMNEEELISRLIKGDPRTWNDFYGHYGPRILDSLRAMKTGLPYETLEEIADDTFVAFLKALPKFRNKCTVLSFLRKIAKNKALSRIRWEEAQKRNHKINVGNPEDILENQSKPTKDMLEDRSDNFNVETVDEDFAERLSFANIFMKLSKRCRTLLALRFYDNLEPREIYKVLKPNEPKLEAQHVHLGLFQCLRRLKDLLLGSACKC